MNQRKLRFDIGAKPRALLVGLLAATTFGGCRDHWPSWLTTPPSMPKGYLVWYANSEQCDITAVKSGTTPPYHLVDYRVEVIGFTVERVGAVGPIIYGIRRDPKTNKKVAFIIDTKHNKITKGIPVSDLIGRLEKQYGLKNPPLVPARYYTQNANGGSRATNY